VASQNRGANTMARPPDSQRFETTGQSIVPVSSPPPVSGDIDPKSLIVLLGPSTQEP